MKKTKFIFIFLLFVIGRVYSHQDSYEIKDFGNIKIRIKSGYNYEEVNKVLLFGKFTQELSQKLNYKDQIFLDFDHYYVGICKTPAYFISFDNGNYGIGYIDGQPEKNFLKNKSIVIRQCSDSFDLQKTLQILEYSIQNISKIKKEQKEKIYTENYCNWKIKTIDRKDINRIINSPISKNVFLVLNHKNYLTEDNNKVSYYFQNNCFTITYKNQNGEINEIIKLRNIYFLFKLDSDKAILFDDRNSFYFINKNKISKRHYIPSPKVEYRLYKIEKSKDDIISFFYFDSIFTGNDDKPFKTVKIEHKYFITKDKLLINTTGNIG